MQVQVYYDTIAATSEPLSVQFDTLRTAEGYPILYATVTATNLSNRSLVGTTGFYCHWLFTAYDNGERTGEPLWNGEGKACLQAAYDINLPAGSTQTFPRTWLDFAAITKTRGPGTYYFAARLRGWLDGEDPPSRWLTERIPAGAVVLLP